MADRTLYYFAVGGTGCLSVEPLLHLCAAGLGPDRLAILLIDPDTGNPALGRAVRLIEAYEKVRRDLSNPATGFFRTELIRTQRKDSVWSPLRGEGQQGREDSTLEAYVERQRMDGESSDALHLLDLLFSPPEQHEKLKEGFRGHPAIGSVLMHGLKDSKLFKELMNSAKGDSDAKFFATGSIFGGTGASALPVIAQLLTQAGVDQARIGAALVTPYYSLGVAPDDLARSGRLKPDSAKFMSATVAALPTYTRSHASYGAMYVVGDEASLPQPRKGEYSAGGGDQFNDPHLIELFAALAALDFADSNRSGMRYCTLGSAEPTWADLPLSSTQSVDLRAFILTANFFLQYFGSRRSGTDEQKLEQELAKGAPWLQDVGLPPSFVREHARELNDIGEYFEQVWGWLWALTQNYQGVRLVSFDSSSKTSIPIPETYASRKAGSAAIPPFDNCLAQHNVRRKKTLFGRGDADRLESPAEFFNWLNPIGKRRESGLPGAMQHFREGAESFASQWYTPAVTNKGAR